MDEWKEILGFMQQHNIIFEYQEVNCYSSYIETMLRRMEELWDKEEHGLKKN